MCMELRILNEVMNNLPFRTLIHYTKRKEQKVLGMVKNEWNTLVGADKLKNP